MSNKLALNIILINNTPLKWLLVAGLGQHKRGRLASKPSKDTDGGDMDREQSECTSVFLYNHIGPDVAVAVADITNEEEQKHFLHGESPPDRELPFFGHAPIKCVTTFVTVGPVVYCIGGIIGLNNNGEVVLSNVVRKFNTNKQTLELDANCPPMLQGRRSPAATAIGKKIYVFGGLSKTDSCSPWAEFLDTKKARDKQIWKPLTEPPFRLGIEDGLYAIRYEADNDSSILIGSKCNFRGALLYGVHDKVWNKYEFHMNVLGTRMMSPLGVASEKTLYWIHHMCLYAYDLHEHLLYRNYLEAELFSDWVGFVELINEWNGPYLFHLQGNLFCCFTVYMEDSQCPFKTGVIECTKFRVDKVEPKTGAVGDLYLHSISYYSFQCQWMCELDGLNPM